MSVARADHAARERQEFDGILWTFYFRWLSYFSDPVRAVAPFGRVLRPGAAAADGSVALTARAWTVHGRSA
jgi:hypothetical protein